MSDNYLDLYFILLLLLSIIATLAVALRFWSRKIRKVRLEMNDYLITLGLVFALAEASLFLVHDRGLRWYLSLPNHDSYDTEEDSYNLLSRLDFALWILWAIAVAIIRSSIIFLYIRIFPSRSFCLTCYAVLTLNGAFSIVVVVGGFLGCRPIACQWHYSIDCTSCFKGVVFEMFSAGFSLLLDVTVVFLPTPMLWGLQIPVRKKALLSGMFGLGTLICAVTAYRLYGIRTVGSFVPEILLEIPELTAFLMCLEVILGVISACLPVLRPIYDKIRDWMKSSSRRGNPGPSSNDGSIPIWIQVSQMWQSRSGRRAGREEPDSIIEMEDWIRTRNCIESAPGSAQGGDIKGTEIHVQREVRVESA